LYNIVINPSKTGGFTKIIFKYEKKLLIFYEISDIIYKYSVKQLL